MKFKKGQRVRMHIFNYAESGVHWVYGMENFLGLTGVIRECDSEYNSYLVNNFFWPESALTLVEEKPELIPFDLERALKGYPVVTRDGRKVEQLHLFQTDNDTHPLHGVVTGISAKWTRDGKWIGGDYIEDNDLFMVPQKKGYWVNLFRLSDGSIRIGDMVYSSESEAKDNPATAKSNYIKTVKIHEETV